MKTDNYIDAALDAVLKAAGSSLKNYTLPGTLDNMREAMRNAIGESKPIWNSPETAPRDGRQILAVFAPGMRHVAAWNGVEGNWCVAVLNVALYEGKWNDTYFEEENFSDEELTAWAAI